jgi:serine/threonine-protein kinase ATR
MATFQTMVSVPELSEVTIEGWHKFLTTLGPAEFGPHLGATCAAFVSAWPNLSEQSRQIVCESLHHTFSQHAKELLKYLNEIVNLSVVAELRPLQDYITKLRGAVDPRDILYPILARCLNNNLTVATLSLSELRQFLQTDYRKYVPSLATGDVFDPTIGHLLSTLYKAACRDGEGTENLRLLAYECIGIVGAVDPYRFEIVNAQTDMIVIMNFTDEVETMAFVLHLIQDLLVDAFRSTSDIKYQTNLAYPIQELLKHCGFTSDLVSSGRAAPVKIRNRWNTLSKDVLDVITPLLVGRFAFNHHNNTNIQVPVYPTQSTYREWLQLWTMYLIPKVSGTEAQKIFRVFRSVVRSKDVLIAKHLLPHIVLNILISGSSADKENIRNEILAVLDDQLNPDSTSTTDKKLLSAQVCSLSLSLRVNYI